MDDNSIVNLFEPVMSVMSVIEPVDGQVIDYDRSIDERILSTPFVLALSLNYIDISKWLYKKFKVNINKNCELHSSKYLPIIKISANGDVAIYEWIDQTFRRITRTVVNRGLAFITALRREQFPLLKYLYSIFDKKYLIMENIVYVLSEISDGQYSQRASIHFINNLFKTNDLELHQICAMPILTSMRDHYVEDYDQVEFKLTNGSVKFSPDSLGDPLRWTELIESITNNTEYHLDSIASSSHYSIHHNNKMLTLTLASHESGQIGTMTTTFPVNKKNIDSLRKLELIACMRHIKENLSLDD